MRFPFWMRFPCVFCFRTSALSCFCSLFRFEHSPQRRLSFLELVCASGNHFKQTPCSSSHCSNHPCFAASCSFTQRLCPLGEAGRSIERLCTFFQKASTVAVQMLYLEDRRRTGLPGSQLRITKLISTQYSLRLEETVIRKQPLPCHAMETIAWGSCVSNFLGL